MLEHHLGWLSLKKDSKFCVWNLLLTLCLRSIYFIIWENDEVEELSWKSDVKIFSKTEVNHGLIA